MDRSFWLERWAENKIGFHRSGVNPLLERFWPRVATGTGRTLVPLCGKSEDLVWLAARGHAVTGVDLAAVAARDFAAEHGLRFQTEEEPPFTVHRSGRITFLVGDFFDLDAGRIGRFELVYDRAALIALPPALRPAYAAHLRSLLAPEGRGLLIALDYDAGAMDGPPFNVPEAEVRALFAGLTIDKIHEDDCLEDEPRFQERGLRRLTETVYRLAATEG